MDRQPPAPAAEDRSRWSDALAEAVRAWIDADTDAGAAGELAALLQAARAGDPVAGTELAERFAGPLRFGTAGLRGPLRAGPGGMNRTVVRRAAAGLAAWLKAWLADPPAAPAGAPLPASRAVVVVGFDARHGSADFARDSAAIFAAAGFDARLLPGPLPTPVLAYAVRELGAALGVMVTASHNRAQDNGYKVYLGGTGAAEDGAQIVAPLDREIEHAIAAVGPARDIPLSTTYVTMDQTIIQRYVESIVSVVPEGPRDISIVHTAMHGVGTATVLSAFDQAGFAPLIPVARQAAPDPDFPTVAFPNPEEPGALDLAVATATQAGADLIIANDPDADRCAVAVPQGDGWRMLRGDDVGVLLGEDLMRRGVTGTYATTIVSSSLLRALADRYGMRYAETLTGFKWIARCAPDLVFGYEEALGYAVAPDVVRDKDGICAALAVAALAARLKADGLTLLDRLDDIARTCGVYMTDQLSIRVDDPATITAAMARLRADPPATLLGAPATVRDLAPAADVVMIKFAGGRVVVRPSGTEPKLKAYLEVVTDVDRSQESALAAARTTAAETIGRLRAEVGATLGL